MRLITTTGNILLLLLFVGLASSCKKKEDNPKPGSSFTHTETAWIAHFTSTATNSPTAIQWDFGDGQTGSGDTITHTYANPGDYTVTQTATNASGSATSSQTITLKERIIEVKTHFGSIYIYLYNQTPKHRDNFLKLAAQGFFDSTTFHRIVPDFVIQGGDPNSKDGDPTNDGYGGPGYNVDFENPAGLTHVYGAVGAASTGARAPSSGSQFYITIPKAGAHNLDGSYTVFGFVMKGMDVAEQIVVQPRDPNNNRPLHDIRMGVNILEKTKAEILADYGYTVK
jgi:cyclophilin family peptidyl-prolyl cis-trans isomerase